MFDATSFPYGTCVRPTLLAAAVFTAAGCGATPTTAGRSAPEAEARAVTAASMAVTDGPSGPAPAPGSTSGGGTGILPVDQPAGANTVAGDVERFVRRVDIGQTPASRSSAEPTSQPAQPAQQQQIEWLTPVRSPTRPALDTERGDGIAAANIPSAEQNGSLSPQPATVASVTDRSTPGRPAEHTDESPGATPPDEASPTPIDHLPTEHLARHLHERLHREATGRQAPGHNFRGEDSLRPWVAAAALSLVDPRVELTERELARLDLPERRSVLAYQRAFTLLGQSLGGDAGEDRQQLRLAAEELLEQLDTDRTLHIRRAVLCRRVSGYGVYEPFAPAPGSDAGSAPGSTSDTSGGGTGIPHATGSTSDASGGGTGALPAPATFLAGSEQPVIVYAELDHFTPELGDDGLYTVRLRQELVLYNESDGLAVWRRKPVEIVDRSRNRRRDFFVVQLIHLPARLTVGRYLLKVSITDEVGAAVDEKRLPLRIVADSALARTSTRRSGGDP